jgi:hypothetical protein
MTNNEEFDDYLITHIGEGKFQAELENGEVKNAGENLRGMIRFTYFEDYTLPDIGWQVTRKQLLMDYTSKIGKYWSDITLKQ